MTSGAACHLLVPVLLSTRKQQLSSRNVGNDNARILSPTIIRLVGLLGSVLTLSLPYAARASLDPFTQCGLRIVCFFYACKLLDLGVARAAKPPAPTHPKYNAETERWKAHGEYTIHMLTEMRYHSFDIAIRQKERISIDQTRSVSRSTLPPIIIPVLALLFPRPETKCLLLLLIIQYGLAALHKLFHPRCPHALFYFPFAATSMGGFWSTNWHACAGPFLRSLAYTPGKGLLGRGFGTIMVFVLSGIWHGWASMPLMEDERAVRIAVQVTMFFSAMGVVCLLEHGIWGKREGGYGRWILTWLAALTMGGWCFRTLECGTKIAWLRSATCPP